MDQVSARGDVDTTATSILSGGGLQSNRTPSVIALFLPSLHCGGAERMTLNLAGALAKLDLPVDLVVSRAAGELLEQVPCNVRVVDLAARGIVRSVASLAAYLRTRKPAGLISRMQYVNVLAAMAHRLAGSSSRLILTEATHGTLLAKEGRLARRLRYRCVLWPMTRRAYRRADAVVAVSRGVAEDLLQRVAVPTARLHVIPNPVVTDRLADLAVQQPNHPWLHGVQERESGGRSRNRSQDKQNRPAPGGHPVVLAVGRLCEAKDFETLLRAFAILRQKSPARLVIIGDGPQRPRLERLQDELGLTDCVDMPGFDENPYSAMANASLFVLSSRREGSPNVLVEALACGCPVVSTDCPCGPSEILDRGRFGVMAPTGDPQALASAMRESLQCEWNADVLRGRARIYGSREAALRYLDLVGMRPDLTIRSGQSPAAA